jgi:hypothetical protein
MRLTAFFPQELFPQTRGVATLAANELTREALEAAGGELADAALELAPASFGHLLGTATERIPVGAPGFEPGTSSPPD